MKFFLRVLLFSFALAMSCNDTGKNNSSQAAEQSAKETPVEKRKPPSTFQDTIHINSDAAVFFQPDSFQLQKIKTITDTMIFASMKHDCFYQLRNARLVMEKEYPKIKIIEVNQARFLQFQLPGGKPSIIDLDNNNDPCGIYFISVRKEPLPADMMNIETSLYNYFRQ